MLPIFFEQRIGSILTTSGFQAGCYPPSKLETFKHMVEIVQQQGQGKKKTRRPGKINLEDQVLMTLDYWREDRIAVLKKVRYALCPRRPMPYAHGGLCPVVPHMRARKAIPIFI
jgi:hypothetical protein